MAINVLLDNCVLMRLFSATEFSGYLKQIIAWQKSGEIVLYCPEALLGEWNKHRKEKLEAVEGIVKNHEADLKKRALLGLTIDIGDAQLEAADKLLSSQIFAIDSLMAEAVQIKDHIAGAMMVIHKQAGKAPYRVNPKSDNDALILFSTCEHLLSIGESELYFFSSNHKDYSMVGHLDQLHPDILESYPNLNFKYFNDYVKGIAALIDLGLTSAKTNLQVVNSVPEYVPIDLNLPLFGQIYQYINRRFDDIRVLPKQLFITHLPFIVAKKAPRDAPPFTLQTDSEAIFKLFVDLAEKVNSGKLNWSAFKLDEMNEDRKQAEVIHLLRSCYVHHIAFNHKSIELPVLPASQCDCLNCKFNRSEFAADFFPNLNQIPDSQHEGMKAAFLQYQVGNIPEAVVLLKKVSTDSEKSKKWLSYYIANYNLFLLGRMYKFSSPEERELPWVKETLEIDLEKIYIISESPSTKDILEHLAEGEFISKAVERLKEISGKIKDNFVDQNRGWNDDARLLLDHYFGTIGFVEHNYLMLDYYGGLSTLTAHFLDGVFASYASHHELGGRMLHFTDAIVMHIVKYARPDDITKYRARYKVQIAEFAYLDKQSGLVRDLINLLNGYKSAMTYYDNTDHQGQRFFWNRFKIRFHNALTLCAILRISKEEINLICKILLPFITLEKVFHEHELLKTLCYFVRNNASQMDKKHLEAFLVYAYTAKLEQRDMLIHTISNVLRTEDLELKLNESQWEEIQARYLVNSEIGGDSLIISEICCLYDFLKDKSQRAEIAKFMLDYLKHKFDANVYYTAVIHKLIKPIRKFTALYEKQMIDHAKAGRRPRIFEGSFYQSDTLDQYINFMFCFNKPFDARFVDAAGRLDNYYRWILDIDGYDYQEFHSDWLFNHLTRCYRERFQKSETLERWTRKSALKSKELRVSKFYIELYTGLSKE